jgi:hypothetical protein
MKRERGMAYLDVVIPQVHQFLHGRILLEKFFGKGHIVWMTRSSKTNFEWGPQRSGNGEQNVWMEVKGDPHHYMESPWEQATALHVQADRV